MLMFLNSYFYQRGRDEPQIKGGMGRRFTVMTQVLRQDADSSFVKVKNCLNSFKNFGSEYWQRVGRRSQK